MLHKKKQNHWKNNETAFAPTNRQTRHLTEIWSRFWKVRGLRLLTVGFENQDFAFCSSEIKPSVISSGEILFKEWPMWRKKKTISQCLSSRYPSVPFYLKYDFQPDGSVFLEMMQLQQTNFLLIKENSANLHFFIEKNCVTINQKRLVTRKTQPKLEPWGTE